MSSVQSGYGIRTGTPKVPPGLERVTTPKVPPGLGKVAPQRSTAESEDLHAHPTRAIDTVEISSAKQETSSTRTIPVLPAIPVIQHKSIVEAEAKPSHEASIPQNESGVRLVESTGRTGLSDTVTAAASGSSKTHANSNLDQPSEGTAPGPISSTRITRGAATSDSQTDPEQSIARAEQPSPKLAVHEAPVVEGHEGQDVLGKAAQAGLPLTSKEQAVEPNSATAAPAADDDATSQVEERKVDVKRPTLRTLNITSEMVETLRRSESQAPLSTTTEKSTAFPTLSQIRQSSRQPSISVSTNISRPSTPAASDRFGLFSQDVSRAGSPPPGGTVIGSAPSRQKTKNQAKKDRREKAKKATEVSESGSVVAAATPPAADNVGPIVARQKKQKKAKNIGGSAIASESQKRVGDERTKEEPVDEQTQAKPPKTVSQVKNIDHISAEKVTESHALEEPLTPAQETETPTPASPEQPAVSYTLRDFYTDASRIQSMYQADEQISDDQVRAEIQDLLGSNVSAFPKLLSEMIASGDLAKDHPLLSPPSFNSAGYKLPTDNRKGQAYLDGNNYSSNDVFGMIYLPQKEKKALYDGHAVSIADPVPPPTHGSHAEPKEDLLRRCLITPTGWVLRHLSRDESEKLLDLEERRQMYLEELGDLGRMDKLGALEENDYVNLDGGFEGISRYGDRHGVCWVIDQDSGRGGRRQASRTNEDDYGLGEMPIDADDFDDEDDRYDDPEHEDDDDLDDEGLDGEDLIQRVVAEDERYDDDDDDDLGSFANLTGDPNVSMALPPLPPSMMMNMNAGISMSGSWSNDAYPQRASHSMYGSLNTPNAHGIAYTNTGSTPGYVMDQSLPPTSELPVPRSTNSNILPPIRQGLDMPIQENTRVNLRAMTEEELGRKVKEKQKEIESSRREVEKLEKLMTRKGKELNKWREGIFKGIGVNG